ncbi:tetratricopeptide repeat protein [Winogradskyella sp. DF17]|uniref:Tetratricopeptide repeat protein n=1 Tax=Winogradskyella pelagia TaxID=2819984 RepID=A0ABS3T2H6_9FLAO|nr:adenylate/guanylate cyclase domain-containing protein [Winogradskyella sp. DF17]MBO3116954.1 tetratricopeptide repeat protein [Winogradskyella sp. DF17]
MLSKHKTVIIKGCILIMYTANLCGQDQRLADSLISVYNSGSFNSTPYELLNEISKEETNPKIAITYAKMHWELASEDSNYFELHRALLNIGNANSFSGNYTMALESYLESLDHANKTEDLIGQATLQISIADTYRMLEDENNAFVYYEKGIKLLRKTEDQYNLASALFNSGDWDIENRKYDQALVKFKESKAIFEKLDFPLGVAYNIGNIGVIYAENGQNKLAEKTINESIAVLEGYEDYHAISDYLITLADICSTRNDYVKAIDYAKQSLDLATQYELLEQISVSNLKLSNYYENKGDPTTSLYHHKEYYKYRDSILNLDAVRDTAEMQREFDVAQEQAKTIISEQKRKNQRIIIWSTAGVLFLTALLAYGIFRRHNFVKATNKIIAAEKDRSDKLLLNILPEETAQELKDKGRVEARKYPSTTVLFSDFKGFTSYAENLSPEKLVQTIDHYFSEFDSIMHKYGLEKIKTIGDAYMAVGGLSFDNVDQAKEMILAAQEMNAFVAKAKQDDFTDATFDIRIGINTGPVVAGVVGSKKFAYDIWGDTVNVASRMESNSEPGRINISEDTYQIVKADFECEYRGEIPVKNRGKMKMYFVKV